MTRTELSKLLNQNWASQDDLLDALEAHYQPQAAENEMLKLIDERDNAEEWADRLAHNIAVVFKLSIGEHSNVNNPWRNAAEYLGDFSFNIDVRQHPND